MKSKHSTRRASNSARTSPYTGGNQITFSDIGVVISCRGIKTGRGSLLYSSPEGPFAMKKEISVEKIGFQRFPTRPKPNRSGHGYSFQLAKTQSRTNPH